MKQLIIFITLIMLLTVAKTKSAEIIPVWDKIWKQGSPQFTNRIHDFEFLRGEDQFIMIAGVEELGAVEIRKTLTGELVTSFPLPNASYFNQIEITPDSNRFVITTGGDKVNSPAIELRSIEDFNLISRLPIQMDDDSVDNVGQPYYFVFKDIVIDPVKPYIYAFITKTNYYDDDDLDRTWLKVYNYETMEEVRDLTPVGYEYELMKCMDISDNGSQLAVINEGKAYLKVWDLKTNKLIRNVNLWDENLPNFDWWCKSEDIAFSKFNNDEIYFSGNYPGKGIESVKNGFFKYSINTELSTLEMPRSGRLCFFDNEERVLIYSGGSLSFVNLLQQKEELNVEATLKYPFGKKTIVSKKNSLIIGSSEQYIGSIKYDSQTGIADHYEEEIIISPNPTGSIVNINLNCSESRINYQINNSQGLQLLQKSLNNKGSLQLDFSPYPIGVYFLTLQCNNQFKTYKVVKEG
jgi:type IX secretion system substrate protein